MNESLEYAKLKAQIDYLQDENKQLEKTQQLLINDVREYSCKYLDRERKNEKLKNENKQLQQQIEGLNYENFELQNDLFTQELNEDETEDYIDSLKNEIFQIYIKNNVID